MSAKGSGGFSVALVGADGAGKTSTATYLRETLPFPVKYVYMGTSIGSSNITLPTSRLLHYLKTRAYQRSKSTADESFGEFLADKSARRGRLYVTARLCNRLFEEWYRQLTTWWYQLRGYVVLFDRHYHYEFAAQRLEIAAGDMTRNENHRLSERIHIWLLTHLYPHPDLVVFLDADPECLLERKQEWSLEHLRRHQDAIATCGREAKHFVHIDANAPFEDVARQATECIQSFYDRRQIGQ